jgi:hypothetical protein
VRFVLHNFLDARQVHVNRLINAKCRLRQQVNNPETPCQLKDNGMQVAGKAEPETTPL